MSINLSFFKFIIIFNLKNKSNSPIFKKLSCFKDFSRFKYFSFKDV